MKKKCLTVLLVATMAIFMTACGKEEKKDEGKKAEISTEVASTESTEVMDVDITTVDDSGDISVEGPGRRWIMEQDLNIPTVASPTDAIEFINRDVDENEVVMQHPLTRATFEAFPYFVVDDVVYTSLDDALAADKCQRELEPGDEAGYLGFGVTDQKAQKYDYVPTIDAVRVKNAGDTTLTYKECFDNGWFYTDSAFGYGGIGYYNEADIPNSNEDGKTNEEDYLNYYVSLWGAPNYVEFLAHTGAESYDQRSLEDEQLVEAIVNSYKEDESVTQYEVTWVFDEYVIAAYVTEAYFGYHNMEIGGVSYYDIEVWNSMEQQNHIDYLKAKMN